MSYTVCLTTVTDVRHLLIPWEMFHLTFQLCFIAESVLKRGRLYAISHILIVFDRWYYLNQYTNTADLFFYVNFKLILLSSIQKANVE